MSIRAEIDATVTSFVVDLEKFVRWVALNSVRAALSEPALSQLAARRVPATPRLAAPHQHLVEVHPTGELAGRVGLPFTSIVSVLAAGS